MTNLLTKDREYIWHPFTPLEGGMDPLLITSAKGVYLQTADGRKIIDAISSWWVNLHGHSHPAIAKAVAHQAAKLEHVIFAGLTHEPAIQLAEGLLAILPDNQKKIFYSDNGSTAVEVGLKMALQFWHNQGIEKKRLIAIRGAYHGDTFGSMSVGDRGLFTKPFFSYLFHVDFIDFPKEDNRDHVVQQFKHLVSTNEVACFIFEPLVQAAAGMRMYSAELLDELITHAKEHDVICIADEVFTGFGRTGRLFASNYLTRQPDIIALSKGLTGGTLPLGVTSCSEKIQSTFRNTEISKTFFHGHSFTANPIACSAAVASLQLLLHPMCSDNISRITIRQKEFAEEIKTHKDVKNISVLGTILAIEINAGETKYENKLRESIYSFFLNRNILIRPLGNVIYVLPPYVITDHELGVIYTNIKDFLDRMSDPK